MVSGRKFKFFLETSIEEKNEKKITRFHGIHQEDKKVVGQRIEWLRVYICMKVERNNNKHSEGILIHLAGKKTAKEEEGEKSDFSFLALFLSHNHHDDHRRCSHWMENTEYLNMHSSIQFARFKQGSSKHHRHGSVFVSGKKIGAKNGNRMNG